MSSDNTNRLMNDLQALLDSMLAEDDAEELNMGIKHRNRRKKRHIESRPAIDGSEYGFRGAISVGLVDPTRSLYPELPGSDRKLLVAQLAKNPELLVANWLGLHGARLDFGLLVDVYLHLAELNPLPEEHYPIGACSGLEYTMQEAWKQEIEHISGVGSLNRFPCYTDY